MSEQYANDAVTTLAANLSSSATSLTVTSSTGFPTSGNFRIRIANEILLVTAVSGNTWTVSRAAEPVGGVQTAAAYIAGATVTCVLTVASLAAAGGGGSCDVQLYGGGGSNLGGAANADGSVLFEDGSGDLSQDYPSNLWYDPDGSLSTAKSLGFGTGTTLYIGDWTNQNYNGVLALLDVIDSGDWAALTQENGAWKFGGAGQSPGDTSGNIICNNLQANSFTIGTYANFGVAANQVANGQTGAVSSVLSASAPNDGSYHMYAIGGFLTSTAATGTRQVFLSVTWTDESNTPRTANILGTPAGSAGLATPSTNLQTICVYPNTSIVFSTVLSGTGSVTYDAGAWLHRLT